VHAHEQKMNGEANMNYMCSLNTTAQSTTRLLLDLDTKTELDNDFILAQCRGTQAAPQLPTNVINKGITVTAVAETGD